MNPLPPQAYTKDTLLKAYTWLQNQNDSIKGLALTPDILVSLFLKAKMNGEESLERPSIQNFKAELKNLAGLMGEFDSSKGENKPENKNERRHEYSALQAPPAAHSHQATQTHPSRTYQEIPTFVEKPVEKPVERSASERSSERPQFNMGFELDERSRSMIREVKNECNLGSETEALRLLISLGFKRMKSLE